MSSGQAVEVTIGDVTYPTIAAAAEAAGYTSGGLMYRIKKGLDCNGKPMSCRQTGGTSRTRACICVETGKRYESIAEAARAHYVTPESIHSSIKRGYRCAGYHWKKVNKQ